MTSPLDQGGADLRPGECLRPDRPPGDIRPHPPDRPAGLLGIINFLISFPICYFILLDGEAFVGSVISLLPDGEMRILERYIERIDRILGGIYIGTVYTSIVGSLIAALTFYLFGIPRPIALASIVFIAGMVPVLTSWVVILPLAVYRYFNVGLEGHYSFWSSAPPSSTFPQSCS